MWTRHVVVALVALGTACAGCSSLNSFQKAEYQAMQAQGLVVEEKSPPLAAGLGLLPGGGSFYTRQYALGIVDLVFWPLSICWDPVLAYHEAHAINFHASKAYLSHLKAKEMGQLDAALATGQLTHGQYLEQKRQLAARFGD